MNKTHYSGESKWCWYSVIICVVLLCVTAAALGQDTYEIGWYSVDGGGTTYSSGGLYRLGGTAGQPDASGPMSGYYVVAMGGFWVARGDPTLQASVENYWDEPAPGSEPVFVLGPNPFARTMTTNLALPEPGHVSIGVYDVSGRKVCDLLTGTVQAGKHRIEWDGRNANGEAVSSGVYLIRYRAGDFSGSARVVLLR